MKRKVAGREKLGERERERDRESNTESCNIDNDDKVRRVGLIFFPCSFFSLLDNHVVPVRLLCGQPDITWLGGITEARRVVSMASACVPLRSSLHTSLAFLKFPVLSAFPSFFLPLGVFFSVILCLASFPLSLVGYNIYLLIFFSPG